MFRELENMSANRIWPWFLQRTLWKVTTTSVFLCYFDVEATLKWFICQTAVMCGVRVIQAIIQAISLYECWCLMTSALIERSSAVRLSLCHCVYYTKVHVPYCWKAILYVEIQALKFLLYVCTKPVNYFERALRVLYTIISLLIIFIFQDKSRIM